MNGTKSALSSLGIMGPLISLIVLLANQYWPGLGLTPELVGGIVSNVEQIINVGAALGASLTGIYGRWKATHQIGGIYGKN